MAESFSFELKLVDDVSRSAKKAADAVRDIGASAKKTQAALDFSKEIDRTHDALKKIEKDPGGYTKLLKMQKELAEQRKKLADKAGVGKESFGESLGKKFNFGMLTSAAFAGDLLAEGALKLGEGLVEAAHKVVEIFTEGIAKAFEESGKEEQRRLAFKLSLGTEGGKAALEDVGRFSKQSGYTRAQTAGLYLPLLRSGFSEKSAHQALATSMDIAAGQGKGGDIGAVQSSVDLFRHIRSKGGVSKKMLVDTLGDVGDTIPDFFKSLGKSLHVSAKTAEKMAEEGGKVDPQLIMNMISASVNKRQGGAAGTGTGEYSKTFNSRLDRLKELPNEYFEKLVDSPAFAKVSDAFGNLLEKLDPESETGARIMASLTGMFNKIIGWFDSLTSDSGIDDLSSGIATAVGTLEKAVDFASSLVGILQKAATIAEAVAAPLAKAMEYGDKLLGKTGNGINSVNSAIGNPSGPDFSNVTSIEELQKTLRLSVASGSIGQSDVGGIVKDWIASHQVVPAGSAGGQSGTSDNGKRDITVNIHPGAVVVQAHPGEDPDHTHQRAGHAVVKHLHNELEKSAAMAGG